MSTEAALTILAVDDEAALERYATAFEPTHDLWTATTYGEAIDALSGRRDPDVVFLSSRLDDYGTEAVIREVRYRDLDCRLLLVDDDVDVERPSADVDGRLTRPIDGDRLRAAGDAVGALERVAALADRYHRLAAASATDRGRPDPVGEGALDRDRVAALEAELDALVGAVVDAGLAPGLYRNRSGSTGGTTLAGEAEGEAT